MDENQNVQTISHHKKGAKNARIVSKDDKKSKPKGKKSKKKDDMDKLKGEVEMDDHRIPIAELCRRLQTNIETVSKYN